MDRHKLEGLTREELVALASELGIVRPRSLTIPELIDEIVSRTESNERERARSRGWLGRARSLLASVIERGLHLPDVAKALRNAPATKPWPAAPPPLATMTLAEIYAAQGHLDKALQVLDEILVREPEHADARSLRQRLDAQLQAKKRPDLVTKRRDAAEEAPATIEAQRVVEANVVVTEVVVASVVESVVAAPAQPVEAVAPIVTAVNEVPSDAAEPEAPVGKVESPAADVAAPVGKVESPAADVAAPVGKVESPAADVVMADGTLERPVAEVAPAIGTMPEVVAAPDTDEESLERQDSFARSDIEELPLPERYDVDEIVGIAVDPTTVYLYWEVRPLVLARAHARFPDGSLVVRLVSVTPSWDGPVVEQRDLPIDALFGDAYLRNLRPASNVRISVGWLAHGVFAPFAIGDPVSMPRTEPAFAMASATARWMPERARAAVVSGQTPEETVAQLLDVASRPPTEPSPTEARGTYAAERETLGERWPTFDLGDRGSKTNEAPRASRPRVGGSSDQVPGGSSEYMHPVGRMND